ncbi:hypothetical protein SAMN05444398_111134 [Roseovarius pacificus]|uniref:Uncharacterized protein n=1 Tax=Roseovarius pacificus TaxID=337701 RepID=A0A1M7GYW0_9RHOB|nr:hypothetical protein [Roseovarius pacificus]GGO60090.1 hypothetical protein GCM10011315_33560 [Roseovarius pacificus]SHM21333.1 hypothetical protein SAMN05444398_111134 [Roseovarius pacificus]
MRLDLYEDDRWRDNPLIQKYETEIELMRELVTDESITVTSIDTQGPAPDVRPGKVFESFVLPEMLQNKILRGEASGDAVSMAADKMRKLIA